MKLTGTIGERVARKRDGATGVIVGRTLVVPSVAHPGIYGKTVVSVRLDDTELAAKVGGDMDGDLGWLRSYFAVRKV